MDEATLRTGMMLHILNEAIGDGAGMHKGQRKGVWAVFTKKRRITMIDCGRKWGKTEFCLYVLFRWAMFNQNGQYYYIAPFQKQAREILWRRAQAFLPQEHIAKINHSEMRITLTNGAFIKLDGADNFEAYRGITPDGLVYDEFKDHRSEFHAAMDPNLAVRDAQLLVVGTPPEEQEVPLDKNDDDDYEGKHPYDLMKEICQTDPDCDYFNMPSWVNPSISRDWLKWKKAQLIARGDEAEWYREYEAKRVSGGRDNIFPMFDRRHVVEHDILVDRISRDFTKLQWFCVADPGSSTCFGVLFGAHHPYSNDLYILDEIYERKLENTSTSKIIPKIRAIRDDLLSLNPALKYKKDLWNNVYDEAATWFYNEAAQSFSEFFFPTNKAQNKKDEGLSLIKDQLRLGKVFISNRCRFLTWEVVNYKRDPKTRKIPKENDHLIDCWRYMNAAAGITLKKLLPPEDQQSWRRFSTPQRDMEVIRREKGHEVVEVEADLADFDWVDYDD